MLGFFDKLSSNYIKKLYLAGNELTDKVGDKIIAAVNNLDSLSSVCISYNKMSKERETLINSGKQNTKESLTYFYEDMEFIPSNTTLTGGLHNECYKAKALYLNKDNPNIKILLELDITDASWSDTNNPLIQYYMGNIWSTVLNENRTPKITYLKTATGKIGIASRIIDDFMSIYNSIDFKSCFPLCNTKFSNLLNILSFSILSGSQDISSENIGLSSTDCIKTFTDCELYKVDHDSANFPADFKNININLMDRLIGIFASKKYLFDLYKPLLENSSKIDILILGLKEIANNNHFLSVLNVQMEAIQNLTLLLNKDEQNLLETKVSFIKRYSEFLSFIKINSNFFLEGLEIQKCIESKETCEYDEESNTKYHFVRLNMENEINHPINISEYIEYRKNIPGSCDEPFSDLQFNFSFN